MSRGEIIYIFVIENICVNSCSFKHLQTVKHIKKFIFLTKNCEKIIKYPPVVENLGIFQRNFKSKHFKEQERKNSHWLLLFWNSMDLLHNYMENNNVHRQQIFNFINKLLEAFPSVNSRYKNKQNVKWIS